jgi:CubicO group peptidase (beta-lactamase class C family)
MRWIRCLVCLLLAVALPAAAGAEPAKSWKRWATPEAAGFSSERLAEARSHWESLSDAPLAALFLVYKGKVLMTIGDVTADFQCHSMRKSFLSALYGIHVDKGAVDLEATLEELGIDDDTPLTQVEKQARVSDLLKARSGIYIEAACESQDMKDARPTRGSHDPGTYWYYNNWDFNALGTIFRQETGRDIFKDFRMKIAQPIGMQDFRSGRCDYYWEAELSRHPCYVFRMSARDRARFGQLFLQQGRWGRKQIVPEDWVDESTRAHSRTEHLTGEPGIYYGYMWWILAAFSRTGSWGPSWTRSSPRVTLSISRFVRPGYERNLWVWESHCTWLPRSRTAAPHPRWRRPWPSICHPSARWARRCSGLVAPGWPLWRRGEESRCAWPRPCRRASLPAVID